MQLYKNSAPLNCSLTFYNGQSFNISLQGNHYIYDDTGLVRSFIFPDGNGGYFLDVIAEKSQPVRDVAKALKGIAADVSADHLLEDADFEGFFAVLATNLTSRAIEYGFDALIDTVVPEQLHYIEYYTEEKVISHPIYVP